MVFQWRSGSRIKGDANQAAEVMQELADKNDLNAQSLVNISRPEDAPLHESFEWNDSVAGEEWRKHQARHMISCLEIVPEETEDVEPEQPQRVYVQIKSQKPDYQPLTMVLQAKDARKELLKQAYEELKWFRSKYATLAELARIHSDIDALMEGESA